MLYSFSQSDWGLSNSSIHKDTTTKRNKWYYAINGLRIGDQATYIYRSTPSFGFRKIWIWLTTAGTLVYFLKLFLDAFISQARSHTDM